MNPAASHPNATRSGGGSILGGVAVWVANKWLGLHLNTYDGIAIAGGLGTLWVFIGRDGLVGAWKRLLHGSPATGAT